MKNILKNFTPQIVFIVLSCAVIVSGLSGTSRFLSLREETKSRFTRDTGVAFANFQPFLKGVPVAGFITNKDLSSENNDGHFLMAQYALAPTVLALNETQHEYSILDCTDTASVIYALRQTRSAPVAINDYGKILAAKTP